MPRAIHLGIRNKVIAMGSATVHLRPRPDSTTSVYDDHFFKEIDREGLASARVIVPLVRELLNCDSVVDVGCGRGAWLRVFLEHGTSEAVGYDGVYVDKSQLLIPREYFRDADLSRPFSVAGRFDLAVCLEVAEHLPSSMAAPLVSTLCGTAPAVLFSAAVPGQGGTQHLNEQWPRYWESLFKKQGYVRLDAIRPAVWREPSVAWWYKQNVFLFIRREELMALELSRLEHDVKHGPTLHLIAEDVLEHHASLRRLLRELPAAVWKSIARRVGTLSKSRELS
jgi:SAM-dependent methyltransferase